MSLDMKITEAIEAAVAEEGQPDVVAKRLIAWLEEINSGNEDLSDGAAGQTAPRCPLRWHSC